MDPCVVEQKLETLRYGVNRFSPRCPATAEELARDPDPQDIILLLYEGGVGASTDGEPKPPPTSPPTLVTTAPLDAAGPQHNTGAQERLSWYGGSR